MLFLLDTVVLAEPARPDPDPRVLEWLGAHAPMDFAISALSLSEIRKGVSLLRSGPKRLALERWLQHDLPAQFTERVLPVDADVATAWGLLAADGQRRSRPLPVVDGLLLATAQAHDLTLVTRNARDCADRGVPVFDPWES
jgi:predicted nucleic acid-binding protein